jgi:hypothetical protein
MLRNMPKELIQMPSSKIISRLENQFGLTFPEIVSKHFQIGMSRYECTAILNDLTGWKDEEGKAFFKQATIWNMVKAGIQFGLIKDFDFNGRQRGNPNYSEKRQAKNHLMTVLLEKGFPQWMPAVYNCTACGCSHHGSFKVHDHEFATTLIRAHQCPKCKQYASCVMEFTYKDIQARKAVIIHKESRREVFVDENLEWVENPFVIKKRERMEEEK